MPQVRIGSRNRRSPYFESTIAAGAVEFTVYNGMFMPTSYGDPEGEYRLLTEGVALWDVAVERQVEIAGPAPSSWRTTCRRATCGECRSTAPGIRPCVTIRAA